MRSSRTTKRRQMYSPLPGAARRRAGHRHHRAPADPVVPQRDRLAPAPGTAHRGGAGEPRGREATLQSGPHRLDPQLELGGLRGARWRPSRSTPTPHGSSCCSTASSSAASGRRGRAFLARVHPAVPAGRADRDRLRRRRPRDRTGHADQRRPGAPPAVRAGDRLAPGRWGRPRLPADRAHRRRRHPPAARRPGRHRRGVGRRDAPGLRQRSADHDEGFTSGRHSTYYGRALAVVRAGHEAGEVTVRVTAPGCDPVTVSIPIVDP